MKNLIPIAELKRQHFPLAPTRAYKWYRAGTYPELFLKIGGRIYMDVDKFWELATAGELEIN